MVHIHAEGPAFFCWIPKLFGKRVICTIHGLDWDREKWRGSVASKFIRGGEKNAVKYADEIIVLSKDVQKYFLETYGRETHFIPNGVNRPEVREAKLITDHFGLEKDSYILFLGRLVPEKGIRYLVEAFKNVKTDKKLVIAGGSSDTDSFMEELKELAKGDNRILFTGFVQGAMLDELYSNAYIYTLPSDLEGMPLSLLEAMSYGNCCLVSDIPECTEVVEDKAYPYMNKADLIVQTSRWEGKSVVLDEAKILGIPILATDYATVKDQVENGKEGVIVEMDAESIAIAISEFLYEHYRNQGCNVIRLPPLVYDFADKDQVFRDRDAVKLRQVKLVFAGTTDFKDYLEPMLKAIRKINNNEIKIIFDVVGPSPDAIERMLECSNLTQCGINCYGRLSHENTLSIVTAQQKVLTALLYLGRLCPIRLTKR